MRSLKTDLLLLLLFHLVLIAFLPFYLWWATTPTNVLHQGLEWLITVGLLALTVTIPLGLVLGIFSLWWLRRIPKDTSRPLRLALMIAAAVNTIFGVLWAVMGLLLILAVLVGVTH